MRRRLALHGGVEGKQHLLDRRGRALDEPDDVELFRSDTFTLVDNFEWDRGWSERFGLWAFDPETQKRTKRPSADLYAAICKENGLSSEMVQKYCPEVMDKLFPV